MQNEKTCRLSWLAYAKMLFWLPIGSFVISLIILVILSIILALLSSFYLDPSTIESLDAFAKQFSSNDKIIVLYIFLLIWIVTMLFFGILSLLSYRSVKLYYDDEGVWLYSGIFPWNKGYNGIKWRDLDSALYTTGFVSWAFKSYTVILSHRFTKDAEIILKNVRKGDKFVAKVNQLHPEYVESNTISEA